MAAEPANASPRELKRQLRTEDRRLRRQQQVVDFKLHWSQSHADVAFLLALVHEAGDFHTAATTYLQNAAQKRSRRQPATDPAEQAAAFYRTWQNTPPGSPYLAFRRGQLAAARAAAAKWLVEWRARQWVAEVNHAKGCAPSTEQVRARCEEELARSSDAAARAPSLGRCPS